MVLDHASLLVSLCDNSDPLLIISGIVPSAMSSRNPMVSLYFSGHSDLFLLSWVNTRRDKKRYNAMSVVIVSSSGTTFVNGSAYRLPILALTIVCACAPNTSNSLLVTFVLLPMAGSMTYRTPTVVYDSTGVVNDVVTVIRSPSAKTA